MIAMGLDLFQISRTGISRRINSRINVPLVSGSFIEYLELQGCLYKDS